MKILLTGFTSLHWGRMEFGNIGNYYIIEPLLDELNATFSDADIYTTCQFSNEFIDRTGVKTLPLNYYYDWSDSCIKNAKDELKIAYEYLNTGNIIGSSPYIEFLLNTDLVIDFSGDMWGENSTLFGKDRLEVGLIKDRVAQIFAKKTAMIAGSPGPFSESFELLDFAKEVYSNFDIVTNRENLSKNLLKDSGFDISKTVSLTCPAFLFKPSSYKPKLTNGPNIGYVLCGWNFTNGSYDTENRPESDYAVFVESIKYILNTIEDSTVYLMSHSNAFPIPPKEFELQHGRDYDTMVKLEQIMIKLGYEDRVVLIKEVHDAWDTKAFIGNFDMLISGRIHAAVAALSQSVPTVIINYGNGPVPHKLAGFAEVANVSELIASPHDVNDLIDKIDHCWDNLKLYKIMLNEIIPGIKERAKKNITLLKTIL